MLKTYSDQPRFDWDVPLGRMWVKILLVGFLLPIVVRIAFFDETLWIWPWTGLSDGSFSDAIFRLLPLFLGVAAWIVLGVESRRTRGAVLFGLCVGTVLVPAENMLQTDSAGVLAIDAATSTGALAALLVIGCVLIAAGNRQQKRTLGRGVAPLLTGLGGLGVLVAFFYPSIPGGFGGSDVAPAAIFLEGDAWSEGWLFMLWLTGLLAFGLFGAVSFVAERISDDLAEWIQGAISRLARVLPFSLPLVALIMYMISGPPGFTYFAFFVIKVTMMGYSILFLAAIALARVLDDADPEAVWVPAEPGAVEAEAA